MADILDDFLAEPDEQAPKAAVAAKPTPSGDLLDDFLAEPDVPVEPPKGLGLELPAEAPTFAEQPEVQPEAFKRPPEPAATTAVPPPPAELPVEAPPVTLPEEPPSIQEAEVPTPEVQPPTRDITEQPIVPPEDRFIGTDEFGLPILKTKEGLPEITPDPTVIETVGKEAKRKGKAFGSGAVGVVSGIGGMLEAVGAEDVGQSIQKFTDEITEKHLKLEGDPTFLDKFAGALGSSALFLIPGMGAVSAARLLGASTRLAATFGAGTAAIIESGAEGGAVFQEAIREGKSKEEAEDLAGQVFLTNLPINFVLDQWIFKSLPEGRKISEAGKGILKEAVQEGGQSTISQTALGKLAPLEIIESAVLGAMAAAPISVGKLAASVIAEEKKAEEPEPGEPAVPGPQKVDRSLIDPTVLMRERARTAKDPADKEGFEVAASAFEDDVIPEMVTNKATDFAVRNLTKENIPYAHIEIDGINLNGGNKSLGGNAIANEQALVPIWGDILTKAVNETGGVISRSKGDEMRVILPNHTEQQAEAFISEVKVRMDAKVQELGFDKIPHLKQDGLITGAFGINFGVTSGIFGKAGDTVKAAQAKRIAMEDAFLLDKAEEQGYIYSEKEKRYVKGKGITGLRAAEERRAATERRVPVETERPEDRGPGQRLPEEDKGPDRGPVGRASLTDVNLDSAEDFWSETITDEQRSSLHQALNQEARDAVEAVRPSEKAPIVPAAAPQPPTKPAAKPAPKAPKKVPKAPSAKKPTIPTKKPKKPPEKPKFKREVPAPTTGPVADKEAVIVAAGSALKKSIQRLPKDSGKKITVRVVKSFMHKGGEHVFEKGELGAVVPNLATGEVSVFINETADMSKAEGTIFHEVIGHFGASKVDIAGLRPIFKSDSKSDFTEAIRKANPGMREESIFQEWVAERVREAVEKKETLKKGSIPARVREALEAFFRKILVKLRTAKGSVALQGKALKDAIDVNIDALLKQIKKAPPRAPEKGVQFRKEAVEKEGKEEVTRPEKASSTPFNIPPLTFKDKMGKLFANYFNRIGVVQKTIEKAKGKPIPEEQDAFLAKDLQTSRAKDRVESFGRQWVEPILKSLAKNNLTMKEFNVYLVARHATERNERIERINDDFKDKGPDETGGSGFSENEIKAQLDLFDKVGKTERLEKVAKQYDTMIKKGIDVLDDAQLMSPKAIDGLRNQFKFYVPLRNEETEPGIFEEDSSKPASFKAGPPVRNATGRFTAPDVQNAFTNAVEQVASFIVRSEKVKVDRALLKLVKDNPNKNYWEVNKVVKKSFFNPKTKKVYQREVFEPSQEDRKVLLDVVTEGGKVDRITFKDRELAAAVSGMSVQRIESSIPIIQEGIDKWRKFMRFFASTRTIYNPVFLMTNMPRDFLTGSLNISAEESVLASFKVFKNTPIAIKAAFRAIRDPNAKGKWEDVFREYKKNGGPVEFLDLESVEDKRKKLEVSIKEFGKKTVFTAKPVRAILQFVRDYNQAIENGLRLSYYEFLTKKGMSPARAAARAKNVTVNFERHGQLGPLLNFHSVFANASMVSTARLGETLQTKKGKAIGLGIVASSLIMSEVARVMGGDDDDGVPHYDKIHPSIKDRNMIVMSMFGTGRHLKIPLAYGYNVLWAGGQAMSDFLNKPTELTAQNQALRVWAATMESFSPMGTGDILQTISPTNFDIFVDLSQNKNFFGGKIRPENLPFGPQRPASELKFRSTGPAFVEMARFMNRVGGGTRFLPGHHLLDTSPENLEHIFEFFTGGPGKLVSEVTNLAYKVTGNQDLEIRDFPGLKKYFGDPFEFEPNLTFGKRRQKVLDIKGAFKRMQDDRNFPEAAKFKRDNLKFFNIEPKLKEVERNIKGQKEILRTMELQGNKERVAFHKRNIQALLKKFNKAWNATIGED